MKKKKLKNTPKQIKPLVDPEVLVRLKRTLTIFIAAFAFILYSKSINHEYTLDDHNVIDKNSVVTTGIQGIPTIMKTDYWFGAGKEEVRGPIYRPVPLLIFAMIWDTTPDSPHVYHFINVLIYALSCMVLFLLLAEMFKNQNLILPFVCTMFYTAHPIHTEVVNNIKSLDEILCFLFGILAIWSTFKFISSNSKKALFSAGAFYILSLLSKETAIAFLFIIPLTIYFFSDYNKKSFLSISILLISMTLIWLFIRMAVLKDVPRNLVTATSALNNTLYAAPDVASRYATAFYILFRYVGLLIFPHPLTSDYNFAHIKIQTFSDPGAFLGLLFYIGIGIFTIMNFRKKSVIAFGILFYLLSIAPVSNIFFLGGASMAERFLYTPSLGFCLIVSYLLMKATKTGTLQFKFNSIPRFFTASRSLYLLVFGICCLYSFKTFARNKYWKDTLTIFSQDIKVSENSATANELLGNSLILQVATNPVKQARIDTFNIAKGYLKKALQIAPGFFYASSNLGYVYLVENKPDSAVLYLKEGLKFGPNDILLNYYYGSALMLLKRYDEAISVLNHTISLSPKNEDAYLALAYSYISKGDAQNGLKLYSKVIEINPNNPKPYYYASGILMSIGDTAKGKEYINKATTLGYKP